MISMMRPAFFASIFLTADAQLDLVSFADVNPEAVCTDGSPAGYYFAPYFTPEPASAAEPETTWLVYLEGGGWCSDDGSCQNRCGSPDNPYTNSVCSSKEWHKEEYLSGIFWPDSETAATKACNKAFVRYCTSDGHMGNGEGNGWKFRGAVVVQETLNDLVKNRGLGAGPKRHKLIFGGGSAGARGAMVHLDYVAQMLGDVAGNVDIVGFLDSPLYLDIPSPAGSTFPDYGFLKQAEGVYSQANVTHLGEECAVANADEPWKCMHGSYRMPFVKTPYMLVASQNDAYQLGNLVQHEPSTNADKAYAENFANLTVELLNTLKTISPASAMYSWACYNHMTSPSNAGFYKKTCDDRWPLTMEAALEQFLGLTPAEPASLMWIDQCTTFNCGSGCGLSQTTAVVV